MFAREERRFSRFRDDTELSRVNLAAGRWTPVSAPFETLVGLALTQAQRTDGLFDPTVLHAMVAAGYDRDFDEVLAGARGALHPPRPCGRWREIAMRPGEILLPAGVGPGPRRDREGLDLRPRSGGSGARRVAVVARERRR